MFWNKEKNPVENKLSKLKTSDVVALLERATSKAVKKFRQELLAQEEEIMEQALRKYRAKVARRSWNKAQQWCKWDDETGPVLMPDKVRLYYRRGDTEVVLQEVPPQIRHLKFEGSLALRDTTSDTISSGDQHRVCSYSLALPYTNFVYRFKAGLLEKAMVSFSDRPLKNLQEKPKKPFFSNINNELKICHGSSFNHGELMAGNITQQISYCLDLFWQTVFKDEWSQLFWQYKSWFRGNGDLRLATLANWQEASLENPLFVIEDVDWMPHTEKNYGVMLVRLFDHDSVDASFQQDLYNDLVDNFLDDLKEQVSAKMKSFETDAKIDLEDLAREFMEQIGAV